MRLSEQEYMSLMGRRVAEHQQRPKPKKAKFKNIRCQSHDGKNFASQLERDYYEQLHLRWKAGDVLWFVRQPQFDLEGGVIYRADFLVVRPGGMVEVIDTKGFETQEFRIKRRQMAARYGIEVQVVRAI